MLDIETHCCKSSSWANILKKIKGKNAYICIAKKKHYRDIVSQGIDKVLSES